MQNNHKEPINIDDSIQHVENGESKNTASDYNNGEAQGNQVDCLLQETRANEQPQNNIDTDEQPPTAEEQPQDKIDEEQPPTAEEQPQDKIHTDEQPLTAEEQPQSNVDTDEQSPTAEEQPLTAEEQPQDKIHTDEQPPTTEEQPQDKIHIDEQSPIAEEQPQDKIHTDEQSPTAEEQPQDRVHSGNNDIDNFGRKILDRTFENILIMSPNSIKLYYSRIKNQINKYKKIISIFDNSNEVFSSNANILFHLGIDTKKLSLYCALPEGSLDQKIYPHLIVEEQKYAMTPILINIDTKKSLARAIELINLTMDINGILTLETPIPVAYAEKYPFPQNSVLRGDETVPPQEGDYFGYDYEDIQGELTKYLKEDIIGASDDEKKGQVKLEDIRQTAKGLKSAIALAEPVVYYYDIGVDNGNKPAFVNIQQVLNDRFLGKLIPQNYFAIAEGSERAERLNLLAIEQAVDDCNSRPEMRYVLNISCRLLIKRQTLNKLIQTSKTNSENLVMAFDCKTLEELGDTGIKGIAALKESGIKIMLDNIEKAGLKALTDYFFDYLRLDARYYEQELPKTVSHLDMLVEYTKVQGITTVAHNVDNIKQTIFMLKHKVEVIQGRAVSAPKRLVHVALKEIRPLPVSGG